jgi:hypothetical protein
MKSESLMDRLKREGRCHCGATKRDRSLTSICHIPGCPYPAIAERGQ